MNSFYSQPSLFLSGDIPTLPMSLWGHQQSWQISRQPRDLELTSSPYSWCQNQTADRVKQTKSEPHLQRQDKKTLLFVNDDGFAVPQEYFWRFMKDLFIRGSRVYKCNVAWKSPTPLRPPTVKTVTTWRHLGLVKLHTQGFIFFLHMFQTFCWLLIKRAKLCPSRNS